MDPPKLENIATTILQLKLLGALQSFDGDDALQIDGRLTFLGMPIIYILFHGNLVLQLIFPILGNIMADLPIGVNASRLIALGYCFSVLEECIIMASAITSQSIFKICFDKNLTTYSRHLEWSNGSGITIVILIITYICKHFILINISLWRFIERVYTLHLTFSPCFFPGSGSDLFAAYHAYKIWSRKYTQGEFGLTQAQQRAEKEFCSKHNLDVRSLVIL